MQLDTLRTPFRPHLKRLSQILAVSGALFLSADVVAQTFPLSSNAWSNPEFVNRFLGSYGVNTRLEPELSRDEATLFQELPALIETAPAQAIERLRLAQTPESSAAIDYTIGSLLLQQGDNTGAIRSYETAIRKFPNFMRAYKNLGLVHLQEGRFADALAMLVKAIELGDGDGNTYGLLGFAYLSLDRPRAAVDAYRIAHILKPENRDWKVGMAQALLLTGENIGASAILKELIEANPTQASYWLSRANALIAMGNQSEAVNHLEMVKRLGFATASTLRLLGDAYLNQDLGALALTNYLGAIRGEERISGDNVVRTARNLVQFGAYEEAFEFIDVVSTLYDETLSADQQVALLNLSAEVSLAQGDDAQAAETLQGVLKVDPLNGRALLLLGNYFARLGEIEEAAYHYQRAATIASVQVEALIQHARMQVGRREYGEAIQLLERAQSIRPATNVENYLTAVRSAFDASR